MVVMVAAVLSHYFLFCSSLCAQGPQLHVPLFNNVVISLGTGWVAERSSENCVCSDDYT